MPSAKSWPAPVLVKFNMSVSTTPGATALTRIPRPPSIEAVSDNAAGLPGKLAGAVRSGKIRRYGIRPATGFAYLCDNTVGFLRAVAVMHENLGTGGGERKCTGAADAARSAGNESGFAGQSSHDRFPRCCCGTAFDPPMP